MILWYKDKLEYVGKVALNYDGNSGFKKQLIIRFTVLNLHSPYY